MSLTVVRLFGRCFKGIARLETNGLKRSYFSSSFSTRLRGGKFDGIENIKYWNKVLPHTSGFINQSKLIPLYRKYCSKSVKPEEELLDTAFVSYHNQQFEEALAACQKLLDLKPKDPINKANLYLIMGLSNHAIENSKKAIECFRQLIIEEPQNGGGYMVLADALRIEKQPKESEEMYLKAIQLQPKLHGVYKSYATLLEDEGRLAEALQFLKKELSLHTNVESHDESHLVADSHIGIAAILINQASEKQTLDEKMYKDATEHLFDAIEADEHSHQNAAELLFTVATALLNQKPAEGIKILEKMLAINLFDASQVPSIKELIETNKKKIKK